MKKCDFTSLDKIWLPEVKNIKPVHVDFTLSLKVSDVPKLLEISNTLEKELEIQEEKELEKELVKENEKEEEEVVEDIEVIDTEEESNIYISPYRDREDITTFPTFSYENDAIKNTKDTDAIIIMFLEYFTNNLVVLTETKELYTLSTKYIEDEFCYFVYDPYKYLTNLIIKKNSKEFKNLLDNLNLESKDPITLKNLMNKSKNAFSNWYTTQSSKYLSLVCCDDYKISIYNRLFECKIENITNTLYTLSIHTDNKEQFWKFTETVTDKTVNDIVIHTLICLFSKESINLSKENNILSSNIYKEFLGYLKFNNLSYYIPLISNISFTIHMKKIGYKTKRTSAGNAYIGVEMKESFTQDWINNFIPDTKENEIISYDPNILKRKVQINYAPIDSIV